VLHNAGISKHFKVVSRQIKVCHQIEAHKFRACRPYLSFAEFAKSDGAGVLSAQSSACAHLLHFNIERQ
jgi:hypothetical protein